MKVHLLITVKNQEVSRDVLHEQEVPCVLAGGVKSDGEKLARCAGKSGTAQRHWRGMVQESATAKCVTKSDRG